ncbi:MAG: EscU/YscU/HrcU family type III secretion system export apparatus switch protein [Phycisphaerae bacterium]|nr:EscU/YscU/HrcU family type III secretion system export apparatus switch protein [Phycisphaerae bacterium]
MPQTLEHSESRTQEATPLRRDEARRSGFVPRGADVTHVIVLLTAGVMLALLGPTLLAGVRSMTATLLDGRAAPLANPAALFRATRSALLGVLLPAGGIIGACVAAAVLAGLVQNKPMTTFEPIRPQWSRLSITAGFKRMVSLRGGVRMLLAVAKLAVLGWLGAEVVRSGVKGFLNVAHCDANQFAGVLAGQMRSTLVPLMAALAGLAVLDWLFQRWQYRRDLRMTRQEWKEDLKRMEGDGVIRRARRKRQTMNRKGREA